jgi:hypothetical protein
MSHAPRHRYEPESSSTSAKEAAPLVEGEGVNAGSADQSADGRSEGDAGHSEGIAGGAVDAAPDPRGALAGYPDAKTDEELVGSPATDPPETGQEHGSSGQDAGSID